MKRSNFQACSSSHTYRWTLKVTDAAGLQQLEALRREFKSCPSQRLTTSDLLLVV
jgi:hypothetical protein